MNRFYGIKNDEELDRQNQILSKKQRADENRKKQNKQSLNTVSACSQMINNVLIGQHDNWVQSMHSRFL